MRATPIPGGDIILSGGTDMNGNITKKVKLFRRSTLKVLNSSNIKLFLNG